MSNSIVMDEFAADPIQEKSFDFVGTIRRRKWLILLGTLCGAGLGYLTFLKASPVYQATARIHVIQTENSNLPVKGAEIDQTPIETEIYLIKSPKIVDAALDVSKINMDESAVYSGLGVKAVGSSKSFRNLNLLDLTFRGDNPDECRDVLQAIVEQYQLFLKNKKEDSTQTVINLITDLKLNVMSQLDKQQRDYHEFRSTMPLISTSGVSGDNLHFKRLSEVEAQRTRVVIEKRMLIAQLESLNEAAKKGGSREALMLLLDQEVNGQRTNVTTATQKELLEDEPIDPMIEFNKQFELRVTETLLPMLQEEKQLEAKLGAAHPKLKSLRARIDYTKNYLKKMKAEEESWIKEQAAQNAERIKKRNEQIKNLNDENAEQPEGEEKDVIAIYMESMQTRIKQFEEQERKLDELFKIEEVEARTLNQIAYKHDELKTNVEQKQRLLDALVSRLEEVSLVQDYGGRIADVIIPPSRCVQVEPNFARIMIIGCILGTLGGLILACLVEAADKSFRSPDDLMSELGLPLIGHIPFMEFSKKDESETNSAFDPTLCTFHKPKSRLAEAYRAVRTALFFSTSGDQHKVIQVTSPTSGDGKSTLAANLAISIAKSGKSVLLMEADYRRPRVHKVFGLDNETGVTNLLLGDIELSDAVQETECEGLQVLTCGPRPHNPAELVTSPQFEALLDMLREKFDFVIVDSPPMLAVTDPSAVAPRVDGVIMTFRLSKRARSLAKQSVDLLRKLGGNVVGVVVNGVDEMDGYGYGSYRYDNYNYGYRSYRYGSKYEYGMEYEYSHGGEYYDDDESAATAVGKEKLAP